MEKVSIIDLLGTHNYNDAKEKAVALLIQEALALCEGNITKTGEYIGISRISLGCLIEKHGINVKLIKKEAKNRKEQSKKFKNKYGLN